MFSVNFNLRGLPDKGGSYILVVGVPEQNHSPIFNALNNGLFGEPFALAKFINAGIKYAFESFIF